MRHALLAAIAGLAVTLGSPAFADDISGPRLADSCTSCHGLEGRGTGEIPALAGQSADDLASKLIAYRTAPAWDIMHRIARAYSDEEIAALAAYFSSVEAP